MLESFILLQNVYTVYNLSRFVLKIFFRFKNLLTLTRTLTLTLNILTNQIEGNGVNLKGKQKQQFFNDQSIKSRTMSQSEQIF